MLIQSVAFLTAVNKVAYQLEASMPVAPKPFADALASAMVLLHQFEPHEWYMVMSEYPESHKMLDELYEEQKKELDEATE